jgi:type I restriction enzyme M protein
MALLLANGSMSSGSGGEGDIRQKLIEADLVECMVALPGQLFTNTQIPACIWFLTKSKAARSIRTGDDPVGTFYRDRRGETLFIDARKLGFMKDRVLRDFTETDIEKIAGTFREWRFDDAAFRAAGTAAQITLPEEAGSKYTDIPGFCKSATRAEIAAHGFVLTPGRYVGAEEQEDDVEPFQEKMVRLVAELNGQFAESAELEAKIRANLSSLGYGE